MARPSTPLISRDATVRAALFVIDHEGLDALSLPRLARELHVKAPSLYHHFANKNAILAAVAREIVSRTVLPKKPAPGAWKEWLVQLALNFRTAVLRHRNAAPVVLQCLPRDWMADLYETAAGYLAAGGVPVELHAQILDGLERLALGSVIAEAARPSLSWSTCQEIDSERHPALSAAATACTLNSRQIFERTVRCYVVGVGQVEVIEQPGHQVTRGHR